MLASSTGPCQGVGRGSTTVGRSCAGLAFLEVGDLLMVPRFGCVALKRLDSEALKLRLLARGVTGGDSIVLFGIQVQKEIVILTSEGQGNVTRNASSMLGSYLSSIKKTKAQRHTRAQRTEGGGWRVVGPYGTAMLSKWEVPGL